MNPESSTFARCVRHPSQFFTGFCSTCLVERLSSVDSAGRSPKCSLNSQQNQVECSLPVSGSERKSQDTRGRKTLWSLFHLDDSIHEGNAADDQGQTENSASRISFVECKNGSENICTRVKFGSLTGVSLGHNLAGKDRVGESFDSVSAVCMNGNERKNDQVTGNFRSEAEISSSIGIIDNTCFHSSVPKQCSSLEDRNLKERSFSLWWGSMFSRKILKWKTKSGVCKRNQTKDSNCNVAVEERQLETRVDSRSSCDQKASNNSSKAFWEDPRHSWDGVVMGKAFTPSFNSIEEAVDGNSKQAQGSDWQNPLRPPHRRKMSLPERDLLVYPGPLTNNKDLGKLSTVNAAEEKCGSPGNMDKGSADMLVEEPCQDISILNTRRKSHGWSKVWSKSLTSPFRDLSKKHENALERSLSESWRELRREKNTETMQVVDGTRHLHGSSLSSVRKQQIPSRSKNIANIDVMKPRPDSQKKQDFMFGRSRSVHYSSPGNLDSGLLRFYLTPLRSSRRTARKGQMKTSRSFARGIFGF